MSEWFDWYCSQIEKQKGFVMFRGRYICPCCFMPTLGARSSYEICNVCFWEDDGQDSDDASDVRGGPNSNYSLSEARENFEKNYTMYRPSDEKAFKQGLIRAEKMKLLYEAMKGALSMNNDPSWKDVIDIEGTQKR